MKKTILLLLLIQSGLMTAQTETVVTVNGKKVTFNNSFTSTADNGLTLSTPTNVQLGGSLINPSVLTTTSAFTLAIKGLTTKGSVNKPTDNIAMIDGSGTLKMIKPEDFNIEPWNNAADNTRASQNTQNIYTMGNVSIGQTTATTKLDVKGTVKIADGTQAANYVLTSNANGLATWKPNQPEIGYVQGTLPQNPLNLDTKSPIYFGCSINLPPGNWILYAGILLNPKIGLTTVEVSTNYMARFSVSDTNTSVTSSTFSFLTRNQCFLAIATTGTSASYPAKKVLFNKGAVMVKTTLPATTLYLISNDIGAAVGSVNKNDLENYFYAIRIN